MNPNSKPLPLHFSISDFSISAFTQPLFLFISAFQLLHMPSPIDIIPNETPVPIRDPMPRLGRVLAAFTDKAMVENQYNRLTNSSAIFNAPIY